MYGSGSTVITVYYILKVVRKVACRYSHRLKKKHEEIHMLIILPELLDTVLISDHHLVHEKYVSCKKGIEIALSCKFFHTFVVLLICAIIQDLYF